MTSEGAGRGRGAGGRGVRTGEGRVAAPAVGFDEHPSAPKVGDDICPGALGLGLGSFLYAGISRNVFGNEL